MLRLWFTAEDLARTRLAAPDPFAETVFSVLPLPPGPPPRRRWRVRRQPPAPLRALAGLAPGRGPVLDLFSVAGRAGELDEGLDGLLGAPRATLDAEIAYFAQAHRGIPDGLRRLLQADSGAPRALARALRGYHAAAVRPYWPRLRAHLDLERERAARTVTASGFEGLFAGLAPAGLRWRAPVLEVRSDRPREYHLDGRGVLLAPSVFSPEPVFCHDMSGTHPHVLVYPAALPERVWNGGSDAPVDRTLAGLLGATRARVLTAVAGGCSSTELARRAGIALSSASEHARVLREAGLLRTERRGGAVHHNLTDLGVQLLGRHR